MPLVLGAGQFIPGFEEHLVGLKAGDSKTFDVKFPDDYPAPTVAGKDATFAVTVKAVEAPGPITIDDEFAKTLGLESLDKLREAVKDRIAREHASASRQKLKRALLDQLDERHKFEPPPSLVEQEFTNVWSTVESDLKRENKHVRRRRHHRGKGARRVSRHRRAARAARSRHCGDRREEQYQGDRRAADRRHRGAGAAASRPREKKVWDHYRNNPNALATLAGADVRGQGGGLPDSSSPT